MDASGDCDRKVLIDNDTLSIFDFDTDQVLALGDELDRTGSGCAVIRGFQIVRCIRLQIIDRILIRRCTA